jgi:hypothetical protein
MAFVVAVQPGDLYVKRRLSVLAILLTAASPTLPAGAGDDEAAQQIGRHWQRDLLAPLRRQSGDGQPKAVAFPEAHRQRLIERVASLPLDRLDQPLFRLLPELNWGYVTMVTAYGSEPDLLAIRVTDYEAPSEQSVPEWLREPLARRVRQLGLPGGTALRPAHPLRWLDSPYWNESEPSAYTELEFAAMVWAGPAVRDHAKYLDAGQHMRIHIPANSYSLGELAAWAYRRGLPLKLSLDTRMPLDQEVPLPILARTDAPVWIVTPQGLVAARLTGLHTGDVCRGGGWLELKVASGVRPAIWAILFLPDDLLAKSAVVKRQQPAPEPNAYLLAAHSRLTVSWPGMSLPMLTVSARKFQWESRSQQEDGTSPEHEVAWGTIVESDVPGQSQSIRISAAGTPECLPR